MKSLNKVQLIGYTASDPKIKVLEKGLKVATFNIATNRQDENKKEIVQFHKITAFRQLAEIVESYIKKGKGLFIEGSLQNNSWTDKNGAKKFSTEIIAHNINMLTSDKKQEAVTA